MPKTPNPTHYNEANEASLRLAARHLEMALRLLESEDLADPAYESERARLALSSGLGAACREFGPFWPSLFADAAAFRVSFRAINWLRQQALDGPVEAAAVQIAVPHVRVLFAAVSRALEGLDRA